MDTGAIVAVTTHGGAGDTTSVGETLPAAGEAVAEQIAEPLLRRRGELVERTFAHAYETGSLRRLYVRGKQNVQKRLLLQAAACNLALLLRKLIGAGTPRALHDAVIDLFFHPMRRISTLNVIAVPRCLSLLSSRIPHRGRCVRQNGQNRGFRHGLLDILQLVLLHPEIVAQFMDDRKADLFADFGLIGADGFNILLIKHDVIGSHR
jgi:hypothetical protein